MNEATVRLRPISIAILAMGGEGGGVLAEWIAELAEQNDFLAQTTSVPGVAQRTGATIYYIEMFPAATARAAGRDPVFALMPTPGDVDIVIASELMEAGRSVERGLVTPDRTTLIASTHRVYAIGERTAVADGRIDSAQLLRACRAAARRTIAFDMAAIAETTGSLISAVLFGALAGSGALPFPRTAFEASIRKAGVGVSGSLAAFAAGFEAVGRPDSQASETNAASVIERHRPPVDDLLGEFNAWASPDTRALLHAAVARLVDYQDVNYARLFLERLRPVRQIETDAAGQRLFAETARQLALAMSYEDTIRVADLKIRRTRFARVREEVKLDDGQILEISEFLHPRTEEIADTLPASLGRWLLRASWAQRLVDRFTRRGKTVKTTSVGGYLLLYGVASLRRWRRVSLRFAKEQQSIQGWLDAIARIGPQNYELALELARLRGLIKGYGDTHARGREKYELISATVPELSKRPSGAERLAELHSAALADESGEKLRALIGDK